MTNFFPKSDSNLSRRAVLHGALFSCASGCSSSISPYLTYTKSRPHSIRLITPWDKSLQTTWIKDFTNWILASNLAMVNVSWLVVTESELSRTPPERLAQISDGLLGGHSAIHRKFQSFPVTTQALKPVRVPIVSKLEMVIKIPLFYLSLSYFVGAYISLQHLARHSYQCHCLQCQS